MSKRAIDGTVFMVINSVSEGTTSSVMLAILLITVYFISDVSASTCPNQATQFSQGYTAVHNQVCYLFVNKEVKWETARDSCLFLDGDMLRVEGNETMDFIKKTLNSRELAWDRNGVWLGAEWKSGKWSWTNGREISYTNWAEKQHSTTFYKCLLMRRQKGWKWKNSLCGTVLFHYNYICQFSTNIIVEAHTLSTDQAQDNGNSLIMAIAVGTTVSLLLISVIIMLAILLYNRTRRKNTHETSAAQFSNNVYHRAIAGTIHQQYDNGTVFTNETQFSSNDALYMTPSEVMESSNDLNTVSNLAKNCSGSYAQIGTSNCVGKSPNTSSEIGTFSYYWPDQKSKLPLMTSEQTVKQGLKVTNNQHLSCCCSDNEAEYVDMSNHQVDMMKSKHAKEVDEKHVYNNIMNNMDDGSEDHYESLK